MQSEFPLISVAELAAPNSGAVAIGPFGSAMKASAYTDTGVPVIRGTNLADGRGFSGEFKFVSEETADRLSRANVFAGDLVFPHRGSIGQVGIVPAQGQTKRWMLSTSLMKLTCDLHRALPAFVYYYFRSRIGRHELLQYASTVGTPGIGQPLTSLKRCRVPLPSLPEQRRIAAVLGALDDKIELNRKMNQTLEEMAQALFKSWFIDFDGHDDLVDSELGPIPRGWEVTTIGESFDLTMGLSPPGSSYNEDGIGLPFFQGSRDFGFRFPTRRVYTTDARRLANAQDTLISVRAPVGRPNIAVEKCCIGRGVAALRHRSKSRSYTFAVAKHLEHRFEVFNAEGTVFGSINKKDFLRLQVVCPPPEQVWAFDAVAGTLDDRIRVNHDEMLSLVALRDTLLPKLISGELRVPEAEAALEATT
jgi:type I restriction enzyme S subunit